MPFLWLATSLATTYFSQLTSLPPPLTRHPQLHSLTFKGIFALGQNTASDGNRIWWGDAWNLTAVGHGVVSWVLMHWIKGSANFYDQNELCGMTWFEQVRFDYAARAARCFL